jgi:hypothetical protein
MRIAALDVGEARIGVAVSDELGITAQPLGVVRRVGGRRDLDALAEMLAPYAPERLVVGLPLGLRGDEGGSACPSSSGTSASRPSPPSACSSRRTSAAAAGATSSTRWRPR